MFFETLEDRRLLSVFSKDVVRLQPGKTYELSEPLYLRSRQQIIGDLRNPPTIRLKERGKSVIAIRNNVTKAKIIGVRFDAYKTQPAIRVSGNSHVFEGVTVTKTTGSAFIIENAEGILIKNCNQDNYTQRGFVYGNHFWNLVIRNVSTKGNLYENEMRFHQFDGLAIINCRIDADNPAVSRKGVVHKMNALRIHDGKRAWINGLTASGNVYFGVMDKENGGVSDLKRGKMSEFKRKMKLTSEVVAENIRIYGNLELGTNLKFTINNLGMVSWDRGTAITINPDYGPFKHGNGLFRRSARGIINGAWVKFTNTPKAMNLSSLIKKFDRKVKINHAGEFISWMSGEITFKKVIFNKKKIA